MTKKNYIVLGVTAVILLGVIIVILINKQSGNWTKDILNTNYDVYYVDCENTENKLNKEVLNNLSDSKIYRTDESGTIKITCDGKENKVEFVKFDN